MCTALLLALLAAADTSPRPGPEVVVHTTLAGGKQPAAGIDFEVLRMGERSIATPEVFGPERAYEVGERITSGETDELGLARVTLPDDVELDDDGLPKVLVRVIEPGYQQFMKRPYLVRGVGTPTAQLYPQLGATARGRVVDARGEGVEADVRAQRWLEHDGVPVLRQAVRARPLPDGRFELHFGRDFADVLLTAEADGVGSAALAGVHLDPTAPPQDLLLTALGEGVLRGRVVGADGRGIAGLPLLARLAEVDGDGPYAREPQHSLRRAEGGGRTEVYAPTDAEGRFELRGLRREPYVVRARLEDGAPGHAARLTPRPVLADGGELRLVVAEPQLVVRVLDARGAPWSGEPVTWEEGSRWSPKPLGWHASPRVVVHPATPIGSAPAVTGDALALRAVSRHEIACTVEPGQRYLVAVRGADFVEPAHLVEVPTGGGRVEVDVRAAPPAAWGTLRLRIATDGSGGDYGVALEDPETGLRLCDVDAPLGAVPSVRAPVGPYRVVVEGRTNTELMHGTITSLRALGRAEAEVDVLADTTTEVGIEIRAGATLELEPVGTSNEDDRAALVREHPALDLANNAATMAMYLSSARVHLQRPGRGPEPVYRVQRLEGSSAAGDHLWSAWPLNERHTSVPVAAGTWTLVARLPGGREVAREVVLRAGETTRVRLAFDD